MTHDEIGFKKTMIALIGHCGKSAYPRMTAPIHCVLQSISLRDDGEVVLDLENLSKQLHREFTPDMLKLPLSVGKVEIVD